MGDARERLLSVPGVEKVDVTLVWDPLWNPDMMSDTAKEELGWTGSGY
jgi:metal-sulfur cluster biosynthetic enzyme